jgi:outer membrane protein insertion porin family
VLHVRALTSGKKGMRVKTALVWCIFALRAASLCSQESSSQLPKTAPQVQQALSSYEGQRIATVEIAGQPDLDTSRLEALLSVKSGQPFALAEVNQSTAALKNSGAAKEVKLELRPQPEGIRVMFVLEPAVYFGIYTFSGTGRFGYSRLLQVADYPPRGVYSAIDVTNTANLLQHFFQQNGYFQAEVHTKLQGDNVHKLVNVHFQANLGRHAKFGKLFFDGAPPDLAERLQHDLTSWRARLHEAAVRKGKSYSWRTLQKATQYLESKLIDANYLGSRAQLGAAEYDPQTHRVDVHFKITLGRQARVEINGAHLWSWTRRRLLPMYEQAGLDPEIIQEGRDNLASYFQAKGYFDVKVNTDIQQSGATENIIYRIDKGQRHKVTSVKIAGNHTLSDTDLRGHIKVQKASPIPFLSHGSFSDQLVRQSVSNLEKVYQAQGFSSVKVTPEITKSGGDIAASFHIEEGPRDMVAALRLRGNNTVPVDKLAPKGLRVVEGQPYSAKRVDQDRNQIIAQYLRMGYLNASFRATAAKTQNNPHSLEVTYEITEGPRVTIDSIATLGALQTRQSLIDRTTKLKSETPLREDELFAAESRLYNLDVFDWAEIDPRRQITTQTDEDVLVKVHEAKRNEIQYGFGFEVINRGGSIPSGTVAVGGLPPVGLPSKFKTSERTFWGPRGTFQYTRRNFRGLGESVTFGVLGARLDQRVAATYTDPYVVGSEWTSSVNIAVERNSENPIFTSRYADFGVQMQKPLKKTKNKTLTLRYDYRRTSLGHLLIPQLVPPEDLNVRLSSLGAAYSYDTRDNALDAKKGFYETAEFGLNLKAIGSDVDFGRLRSQYAYYKNIGAGIIWANSLRIGVAQPFSGSRVPTSELFFSGGGSTLRGFPLNGAGEQRNIQVCGDPTAPSTCGPIKVPTGGRQLLIINSELRIPVPITFPSPINRNLGFAAFYDGGNVFPSVGFHHFAPIYSNSVGVGLRYTTPLGPVRVDFGHNLNAPPGIKPWEYFITLGQAF